MPKSRFSQRIRQLSYLNRLRPLNATTANTSVLRTPETLINATAENNQQEQALLSLKMREMNWKQVLSLMTLHPLNLLCYNYNSWTKANLSQRIRNKLNRSNEAEVPQVPLQHLQPSFLPRNHQQFPARKA